MPIGRLIFSIFQYHFASRNEIWLTKENNLSVIFSNAHSKYYLGSKWGQDVQVISYTFIRPKIWLMGFGLLLFNNSLTDQYRWYCDCPSSSTFACPPKVDFDVAWVVLKRNKSGAVGNNQIFTLSLKVIKQYKFVKSHVWNFSWITCE